MANQMELISISIVTARSKLNLKTDRSIILSSIEFNRDSFIRVEQSHVEIYAYQADHLINIKVAFSSTYSKLRAHNWYGGLTQSLISEMRKFASVLDLFIINIAGLDMAGIVSLCEVVEELSLKVVIISELPLPDNDLIKGAIFINFSEFLEGDEPFSQTTNLA